MRGPRVALKFTSVVLASALILFASGASTLARGDADSECTVAVSSDVVVADRAIDATDTGCEAFVCTEFRCSANFLCVSEDGCDVGVVATLSITAGKGVIHGTAGAASTPICSMFGQGWCRVGDSTHVAAGAAYRVSCAAISMSGVAISMTCAQTDDN